ncbi:hypothetical protein [Mesorhizobium sp. LSHC414A00]|uniref:hypothetical protein n=1 Tax=Mesorhizobium sp. LSHC414A00 TaxID=1287287 RepID=UPI0003CDD637|nr:hypothetical protein [Mesorhizobium sp. LSHC414A00]ESX78509.1 hypothetical protein X757_09260 [Mesorhizobium sp. LSHC414A00]
MTFNETTMNPADIAAMTEFAPTARSAKRSTRKAGGQDELETQNIAAASDTYPIPEGTTMVIIDSLSAMIANDAAKSDPKPVVQAPLVSKPKVSKKASSVPKPRNSAPLADSTYPDAATPPTQPTHTEPHLGYQPTAAITEAVDAIINMHRLRQSMIKAQTKLKLQAMASIRFAVHEDGDYDSDESKAKARKRADALYRTVEADPSHALYGHIMPYIAALEPLDAQRAAYEKELVKLVKRLPVYEWARAVKGFGDVSFATIVGECGDIGTYRNPSCVWKRMGLAVFGGKRQGAPGEGATAADWITHGYSKVRRSVSWNMRNNLIGGMGKYRPMFGEDVRANPDLTELQCVFVERARYESEKLGLPVTESDKGKESYKKHPINRAMRYTEKRLLRELYSAWRRA